MAESTKKEASVIKATMEHLMHEVIPGDHTPHAKVTVVGVGQVGMACAFTIISQHISSELALVDVDENKLKGEMMDLQHGMAFSKPCRIRASTDYSITAGSRLCVITAGARQREGESRLDLVQRNVSIFKTIVHNLVKYSPDTILIVVSNPVDVLTYVTWKLSGFPQERVFGSGTNLDSSRFRFLLSERLNLSPNSCHGWIIGEHGDSSVAVWSGVNVAGVPLRVANPAAGKDADPEHWDKVHEDVIKSAYEIIRLKGYTSWGIGQSIGSICYNALRNTRAVCALSTNVKGMHGITEDVYLSLPCVVGENGITHIIKQQLTDEECAKFCESAKAIKKIQDDIKL